MPETNDAAEMAGRWIGGGVALLFRLGLLALFAIALARFSTWISENSPAQ